MHFEIRGGCYEPDEHSALGCADCGAHVGFAWLVHRAVGGDRVAEDSTRSEVQLLIVAVSWAASYTPVGNVSGTR